MIGLLLFFAGIGLVGFGVWQFSPPIMYIVIGVFTLLIGFCVMVAETKQRRADKMRDDP